MDLRYALRQMLRQPRFTFAAVGTLALGIGATAAVYAVVDAVYLKPLPYDRPERILTIRVRAPSVGNYGVAAGTMAAVGQLPAVEFVAAAITSEHTMTGGEVAQLVRGEAVSTAYFAVFGVRAAIGRTFIQADHPDDRPVVLSHGLWQRSFGSSTDVIGRAVHFDGLIHTVVGVMPREFPSLEGSEFWTLLNLRPGDLTQSGRGPFDSYARLRTDDLSAARLQAASVSASLAPIDGQPAEVMLAPIAEAWTSVPPSTLFTLLGAVSLVLLIACGNVANLLLVRGRARALELTVRGALGATRVRLLRQLLTESLLLATLAAAAGVALAWVLIRALFATALPDVARLADTTVDWRVVGFAIVVAAGSVLFFGMAPAAGAVWRPRRIVEGGRTTTRAGRRLSQVLIAVEIALTLALLIGSIMMITRLHALLSIEIGFDTRNIHVASLRPSGVEYSATRRFYERVVGELRQTGLEAASISRMPIHRLIPSPVEIGTGASGASPRTARMRIASDGALGLLRVPILRGRDISQEDSAGAEPAAVINATLAGQLSAERDPLGSVVSLRVDGRSHSVRIVGVAADFRDSYFRPTRPELYVSALQFPSWRMHVIVRSSQRPEAIAAAFRRAVAQVDPRQAVADVTTADALAAIQTAYSRFMTTLVSVFAGLALLLAVSGIGSVVAASVAERTREIGIRVSLGAAPRHLAALLAWDIAPAVIIGAGAGLLGSYNLSHLMRWLMAGAQRFDLVVYAATVLALLAIAGLAGWVPLRGAYRIDPAIVLRSE